jgi:membrane-associated phospholipid phosphatase
MRVRCPLSGKLVAAAAMAAACCGPPARTLGAQVTFRAVGQELGHAVGDIGHLLQAPLNGGRRDWAGAAATGATFGMLLPIDAPVDRWVERHPNAVVVRMLAPFREEKGPLARLPTAVQLGPISASLIAIGAAVDNRALREAGFGCLAGLAVSNAVRFTTYAVVARPRPSAAADQSLAFAVPGGSWDHQSFPAGHATNAFACATYLGERFDLSAGEPVLYAAALFTSLSRIADRRHWTSDTFLGIILGSAVGHTIARRYVRRDVRRDAREAGTNASKARDIAPRHTRLAAPPPVVVLWRTRF